MSSDSDIEMQSALPKKATKKTPKSPSEDLLKKNQEPKKISTKDMIKEALKELHTRKGVSLHAIKKYITEKHHVNVDKINYIIKKNIKTGVEDGTFVQTKGVGASGSFKLAPKKKEETTDKPKKKKVALPKKPEKTEKVKKMQKETDNPEKKEKKVTKKMTEGAKISKTMKKNDKPDKKSENVEKKSKVKMAKEKQTPAKKRAAMMKRKSIGSIIKPPKMKPKARA